MSDLLIHNCHVLAFAEANKAEIQRNQDILVQAGKILAIQPTAPVDTSPHGMVIEAHEMLAMPGLINCHAHVPMVLFRGLVEDVSVHRWFNEMPFVGMSIDAI